MPNRMLCSPSADVEQPANVVFNALDWSFERGITPIAVNVIPVLLCPNQSTYATRTMRLLSRRRVWLFPVPQVSHRRAEHASWEESVKTMARKS
jgi:hypothetical protein